MNEVEIAAKIGMFYEFLWNRQEIFFTDDPKLAQEINAIIIEFEERFEEIVKRRH